MQPPNALLELAEMRGYEREIDLSALSPRQQADTPGIIRDTRHHALCLAPIFAKGVE